MTLQPGTLATMRKAATRHAGAATPMTSIAGAQRLPRDVRRSGARDVARTHSAFRGSAIENRVRRGDHVHGRVARVGAPVEIVRRGRGHDERTRGGPKRGEAVGWRWGGVVLLLVIAYLIRYVGVVVGSWVEGAKCKIH